MEASFEYTGEYQQDYALGIGPTFGFMSHIKPGWDAHAYTALQRYGLGEQRTDVDLVLEQRFSLDVEDTLRLSIFRTKEFTVYRTETMLSWQRYF